MDLEYYHLQIIKFKLETGFNIKCMVLEKPLKEEKTKLDFGNKGR
jgi:hypothetical protein